MKLTVLDMAAIHALMLDPTASLPDARPVTEPRSVRIEDRYLDTAGGALRDRELVARVRVGAEPPRLTVKSLARRGQGAVHRRLELEGGAGAGDDPRGWPRSEARDLLLATIGGERLTTLAIIRQDRLQREVAVGGSIVELSLDEVEVVPPAGDGDRWVELECELRSGDEADLARLGDALGRRHDLEPATSSKLDRALAVIGRAFTKR